MTPRFSHIAGDATLDLINTVEWRLGGPEREEDLTDYADVLAWCHETELVSPQEAKILTGAARQDVDRAADEHRRVIALREAAYGALFDHDETAAESVARDYREAIDSARLALSGEGWRWQDDALELPVPRRRIARALVKLLRRDDLDRLHQCEDAICGWVYLDLSPRRNRRWCASNTCGDRNRARAYYARKHQSRESPA